MEMDGIKLVSAGQTGADSAALDFALDHGIPHGGWCPRGRKAEDGTIDAPLPVQGNPEGRRHRRAHPRQRGLSEHLVARLIGAAALRRAELD